MLLFDATHTSHTRAHTGIQRVCRSLHAALTTADRVVAICFDPQLQAWRVLDRRETSLLNDRSATDAARSRGARWSLAQKLSGHAGRLTGRRPALPEGAGLVCPELFSARVGARLPDLLAHVRGPGVALFHDAIGLKYPELTPPATVARLPAYLHELLQFDGIAAISEDSAESLRSYWEWLGVKNAPPVQVISPGLDDDHRPTKDASASGRFPRVLCVATIEGRKNHLALLEAAESLWQDGLRFELELIGLPRNETAAPALALIETLRQAGRPLSCHGSVSETALHAAYARCSFTVYPSLIEGFGLPVLESLRHGKPCICSARGALGESAREGGCLALDTVDAESLGGAMRRLLSHPIEIAALAQAAGARTFRSWENYVCDLESWMTTLSRRPARAISTSP
jgi:glycosyltransferase involved in cell wall biosynthesis